MGDILVASPEAVDAYKTYLYRQGQIGLGNAIKPGELIDVAYIEKHIATLNAAIDTMKGFSLSYDAEMLQYKGLLKLRQSVVGRRAPTKTEEDEAHKAWQAQKQEIAIQLYKIKQENLEKQTQQEQAIKAKLKQAQVKKLNIFGVAVDPEKTIGGWASYLKPIKNPILTVKPGTMLPVSKPKESLATLNVGRVKLEQEFIMRVGMVSNLNVLIEQVQDTGIARFTVRLRCKHCSSLRVLDDGMFLSGVTELTDDVDKFCRSHRHEAPMPVATEPKAAGRRFREDD